jgi:hypothetical protein
MKASENAFITNYFGLNVKRIKMARVGFTLRVPI